MTWDVTKRGGKVIILLGVCVVGLDLPYTNFTDHMHLYFLKLKIIIFNEKYTRHSYKRHFDERTRLAYARAPNVVQTDVNVLLRNENTIK